jgi:hypothetical protein
VKIADADVVPALQPGMPEASAILIEMKTARIRICANASPTLVAATLKALRS